LESKLSNVELTIVDRAGDSRQVTAQSGQLLMEVLRESVDLTIGTCGGQISCGTCLVQISPEWAAQVTPAGEEELEMLEALDAVEGSRLSCQLAIAESASGMSAIIAPGE
jgi:2Fe-2S ferredoxin